MKLICLLLFFSLGSLVGQVQQENRRVLYSLPSPQKPLEIKPGESFTQTIRCDQLLTPKRRMLRVVGGVKMPAPFTARGEELFRQAEYLIDDNLDSLHRVSDKYALCFSGENDSFERYAYNRILRQELPKGEVLLEVMAKRGELTYSDAGEFGVMLEIYYGKEGRHADDIYDRPDTTLFMPIQPGDGTYQRFTKRFVMPDQAVCAVVRVGGASL